MELRLGDRIEGRCLHLEQRFNAAEQKAEARFISHVMGQSEFELWRPEVERRVNSVKLEVSRLNKFMERESLEKAGSKPGIFFGSASARPPAGSSANGPIRHRDEQYFRDHEFAHVSGNGTNNGSLPRCASLPHDLSHAAMDVRSTHGRLPKMNFPVFDGENSRLWQSRCESYFDMYSVEKSMWIKVASMHFEGTAARWLQSVTKRLAQASWVDICRMIHDRFGKEQHETLIRQIYHIKQTGSVTKYVENFCVLVDHLAAYEASTDQLYYTIRFIDGLKDDIQSVVMVQRPPDLDTACSLAMVQEEAAASSKRKEFRLRNQSFNRTVPKPSFPLPVPPKIDKAKTEAEPTKTSSTDEIIASLKAYRRDRGLCDKCAEKWRHGHKCATTVQLHVMQEMWDLLADESTGNSDITTEEAPQEHIYLAISSEAITGKCTAKTLQLRGSIQGKSMNILVDSGSSHTFISSVLASNLTGLAIVSNRLYVQVANGDRLACDKQLRNAKWHIQGVAFVSNLKVISLPCYDMILGMDWLATYSPMKVDWANKWMYIPYNGLSYTATE